MKENILPFYFYNEVHKILHICGLLMLWTPVLLFKTARDPFIRCWNLTGGFLLYNVGGGWVNKYAGNLWLWKYKAYDFFYILVLYINGSVRYGYGGKSQDNLPPSQHYHILTPYLDAHNMDITQHMIYKLSSL